MVILILELPMERNCPNSFTKREKWHLYKAPIELEFDPRYGEIQVVPRNN